MKKSMEFVKLVVTALACLMGCMILFVTLTCMKLFCLLISKCYRGVTICKDTPGEKHCGCKYFVLDLTHDKHAIAAIRAYADSCCVEFPLLAADLYRMFPQESRKGSLT